MKKYHWCPKCKGKLVIEGTPVEKLGRIYPTFIPCPDKDQLGGQDPSATPIFKPLPLDAQERRAGEKDSDRLP